MTLKAPVKLTGDDITVYTDSKGWILDLEEVKYDINKGTTITVWVSGDWSLAERDATVTVDVRDFELSYTTDDAHWSVSGDKYVVPGESTVVTCKRDDEGMSKDGKLYVVLNDTLKGNNVVKEVTVTEGQKTVEVVITPTDWANYDVSFTWEKPEA